MPIIISAAEFEISPLKAKFGETNFKYLSCGIGSINAARNEKELVESCKNEDVIFIGSCGTLGEFKGIELVTVKKVYWLPPCERLGKSWSIEGISKPFDLTVGSLCDDLPQRVALASPTIAKTSEIESEIRKLYELPSDSELVENLELYSCAAIQSVAKSFTVVMSVTNKVCLDGRSQWRSNFIKASKETADYLIPRIERVFLMT